MKAQATVEFMMIFLVTMAAIMIIFYPIAKAHKNYEQQSDFIKKKQEMEDYLVGLQVYCNGGLNTSVADALSSSGCEVLVHYEEVKFRCGGETQEFPGFFKACVEVDPSNVKRPI